MVEIPRGEWRTEAIEDFLKHVYLLQQQIDPVPTNLLARALDIAAPSVTEMIKRLSAEKRVEAMPILVEHAPYRGVRLTEAGQRIALEVVRHHRLIELYLMQKLNYTWDEVHEEADKLEHHISELFEARIAESLGNPPFDPHGDPIPALDGTIETRPVSLLADLEIGTQATISRIVDQAPQVLRYLADLGLLVDAQVLLAERAPLGDTLSLRVGEGQTVTISSHVGRKILVHIS
jgi:DtxR family transcriptional regulator, Mn-dependent transcriptional regulator